MIKGTGSFFDKPCDKKYMSCNAMCVVLAYLLPFVYKLEIFNHNLKITPFSVL